MKKRLSWMLVLALAVSSVGVVQSASAENIQSINAFLKPKKLFKTGKRKTVSLFVDVATTNPSNPFGTPSPTTLAKVDFDKDVKFDQKGLDTCNPGLFTSATTTDQAQNLCPSSKIGGGSSKIAIPTAVGSPPLNIDATVTAFNGKAKTLVLHTYNSVSGATVLVGKLSRDPAAGRKYGTTLTVPVPPLAGGTAVITEFQVRVKKSFRFRGRRHGLVSSTCRDKRIRFQARFTYKDGTSDDAQDTQKCKQLRSKRKHHH